MSMFFEDSIERFMRKVEKRESGCWEWTGCIQSNGYGRVTVNRVTDYAHRYSYRMHVSEIASGMDICHRCDNRRCVNPSHLFQGTRKENMQDAVMKNRQASGSRLPNAKIFGEIKQKILDMAIAGIKYREIADRFGITPQQAGKVAINQGVRRNGKCK